MPEGDAVRRTAHRLDIALAGRELLRGELRVPRYATVDLVGARVLGTEVAGKHLLTRMVRGDRRLTLHSHLRMEGRWATGAAAPRPLAGPAHEIRAWLVTADAQAVGLRLAMVEVLPTADEARLVGHLGPDILGADFDDAGAAAAIARQGARAVGESLLDQRVISGLGTIWTAETLYAAGCSPWSRSDSAEALAAALGAIRAAMLRSVAAGRGAPPLRHRVYGRAGQPCLRCGRAIRSGRLGVPPTDRITYWCPGCQPGPTSG